jgi:hypothetical protein
MNDLMYRKTRKMYGVRVRYWPSTTAKDPPAATHIEASIEKVRAAAHRERQLFARIDRR